MRNQKQLFHHFKPAMALFAFAVLTATSAQLLAANTVNPPGWQQQSQPHFKFVVPIKLTNLDSRIVRVVVQCYVDYERNGVRGIVGVGDVETPVDAAGKVDTTVTVSVYPTSAGLNHLFDLLTWRCDLYGGQKRNQPNHFVVDPNTTQPTDITLRSGSLRAKGVIQ